MNWELLILVSLAIASITITISKTAIFKPLRSHLPTKWLKKLFNCPYCLTHYLSFFAVIGLFEYHSIINFLVNTMAMVTISSFFALIIYMYLIIIDD